MAQWCRAHAKARPFTGTAGPAVGSRLDLTAEAAEQQARQSVHAAETRARFLDDTVVPYLGTAGPTGRIADQQLRLLAWEHSGVRGYDEAWRP